MPSVVGRLAPALLLGACLAAQQPQAPPAFTPPENIDFRKAAIMSEGTRLGAEVFTLKSLAGRKLPCVLMAHGWGGTALVLRRDALAIAQAGYFVASFDYRGWGASDSRLILTGHAPAERPGGKFTAEVQEVREVVDPIDFGTDWLNAIHWLAGEPGCDAARIGLWGSSLSGGLVVWAAARDSRVKAFHSQVGAVSGRSMVASEADRKSTLDESTQRARGEIGYPQPGARVIGNLRGAPVRSKFTWYSPVDDVDRAPHCAMQFVIAEKEELFDNRDHAILAHARAKGPKRLITIPAITHYGIYREAREQALKLALEWFDQHLKGSSK